MIRWLVTCLCMCLLVLTAYAQPMYLDGYAPPRPPHMYQELRTFVPLPDNGLGVALSGSLVYVATGCSGLYVCGVDSTGSMVVVGQVDIEGYAEGVAVVGNTAYVAAGIKGVVRVDVTVPSAPVVEPTCNLHLPGYTQGVTAAGHHLYVNNSYGVHLVCLCLDGMVVHSVCDTAIGWDYVVHQGRQQGWLVHTLSLVNCGLHEPAQSTVVDTVGLDYFAFGLCVNSDGSRVYLACGANGVYVYNVDLGYMEGFVPVVGFSHDVAVDDRYMYVSTANTLMCFVKPGAPEVEVLKPPTGRSCND